MATIQCAISGITFKTEHLPISLSHKAGYFHPIFALPTSSLYSLYSKHCQGHLTQTDSYLLFLAIAHSTGLVTWSVPSSLPVEESSQLVENNIHQLLEAIELSNAIELPNFRQPSFSCTTDTSSLETIPNWIGAWLANIESFKAGAATARKLETLKQVEKKLEYYILSGSEPKNYSTVIASWASKAASFPPSKDELWQRTIRSCFSSEKMFATPLPLLKEIKEYVECNIEAGSIHFHTLTATLKEGIARHSDFLGMDSATLGYTLLPSDSSLQDAELEAIKLQAPETEPLRTEYESDLAFLRAKLRYRVATATASDNSPETSETSE